jgi:hypothetical protein
LRFNQIGSVLQYRGKKGIWQIFDFQNAESGIRERQARQDCFESTIVFKPYREDSNSSATSDEFVKDLISLAKNPNGALIPRASLTNTSFNLNLTTIPNGITENFFYAVSHPFLTMGAGPKIGSSNLSVFNACYGLKIFPRKRSKDIDAARVSAGKCRNFYPASLTIDIPWDSKRLNCIQKNTFLNAITLLRYPKYTTGNPRENEGSGISPG